MGSVRFWEEVNANIVPPFDQLHYDGWLMRFTHGYSRNNSSVWPLYVGKRPLTEKLAFCEAQYAAYGLSCGFRLTEAPEHQDLDAFLAERGYSRSNPNLVMLREDSNGPDVDVIQLDMDEYLETIYRIRPGESAIKAWERQVYQRLILPTAYVVVEREGEMCGYGRSVQQGNIVKVANLWVMPKFRRQGVATQLINGIFQIGRNNGATNAAIAVNEGNDAARQLYERLGFVNHYLYWYRVPLEEAD